MPEVVEIEFLRKEIQDSLKGKKVVSAFINKEAISNASSSVFNEKLKDSTLINTMRFGKILGIEFSNNFSVIVHFLLTGFIKLQILNKDINSQAGIIFEDKNVLTFNGIMKGGFIRIYKSNEILNDDTIKKQGIDVLDKSFTLNKFEEIIHSNQKKQIKEILIDQKIIAGLGNAYSDEILFLSKILPTRTCVSLKKTEIELLYNSIYAIINEATKFGGASELGFLHLDGSKGTYQNHFKVHKKEGECCSICGMKIKAIKFKSRTSYYCQNCQK